MVRPASETDWPEVEQLLRAMGFTEGESSEDLQSRFFEFIGRADHCVRVADEGARLIGYAWAQDLGRHLRSGHSTVRLHDLWVDPEVRRRGVGRALLGAVRDWTNARGARWLQWHAGTTAARFYAALGIHPSPGDEAQPFYELEFEGAE